MWQDQGKSSLAILAVLVLLLSLLAAGPVPAQTPSGQAVELKEPAGIGAEISTEELKQILAGKKEPVVDVRTPKE